MADLDLVPDAGDTLSIGRIGRPVQGVVTDGGYGIVATAGEIINGGRAIFVGTDGNAYMADNTVLAEVKAVIGVSQNAAVLGDFVEVAVNGAMVEPSITMTPGDRIYFDNLGMLTATAPATGHHRAIGVARSATSILVNVGEVIAR